MTRIAPDVRPSLAASPLAPAFILALMLAFIPGHAHAQRVFFGFGFGFPYPYPYYYRPPVVVAVPPPAFYAPPPYYAVPPAYAVPPVYAVPPAYAVPPVYAVPPAYAAPSAVRSAAPLSTRCNAGAVICPLPSAAPVGSACSCPGSGVRRNGIVG